MKTGRESLVLTNSLETELEVEVLRTRLDMAQIEKEFSDFYGTSPTIFSSWEWLTTWLSLRPNIQCYTLLVRNAEGVLIAVAPFYLADLKVLGLSFKCLRMLGDHDSAAEYLMPIVATEELAGPAFQAIAGFLKSHQKEWDCLWMPAQAAWEDLAMVWLDQWDLPTTQSRTRAVPFSSIPIPQTLEALVSQQSKSHRTMVHRVRKRYGDAYSVVAANTLVEITEGYRQLKRLHELRWSSTGIEGAFSRRPLLDQFFQRFLPLAFNRGWIWIDLLRVDGEVRAAQFGLVYQKVYHLIQEGFDPDFDGAGNLLRSKVLERCCDQELVSYDFLGGFSEHKRRWGAVERSGSDVMIASGSFKGRVLHRINVWPSGRFSRFT